MKSKRWVWLLSFVALPLLALACGGDGGGTAETPGGDIQEISGDDLASMVRTAEEVGEALPGLAPVQQTHVGPVSNEDEIDRAIDPDVRRADIQKYGRVSGYEASYSPLDGEEEILIMLELYQTPEGASGFLRDMLEDPQTFGGLDEFDASGIGDEAGGRTGEPIPGVPATGIVLRVDRVVAVVSISQSEEDVRDGVRQLAEKVARRVEAALEG
jgi:hypothetical protein